MRERLIELIQHSVNGCARNWAEVIADYLLANGVIVPPCKVGDMVYRVSSQWNPKKLIWETVITDEVVEQVNFDFDCITSQRNVFRGGNIGKTVFLTKEEAENALKAREVEGK